MGWCTKEIKLKWICHLVILLLKLRHGWANILKVTPIPHHSRGTQRSNVMTDHQSNAQRCCDMLSHANYVSTSMKDLGRLYVSDTFGSVWSQWGDMVHLWPRQRQWPSIMLLSLALYEGMWWNGEQTLAITRHLATSTNSHMMTSWHGNSVCIMALCEGNPPVRNRHCP